RVTLDQFELVQAGNKALFKFNIISATPERRVSGHVLVYMASPSGLLAWPEAANASLSTGIKYSQGESFAVSRLRPTNAEFTFRAGTEMVRFIVYIFNREGDLLLIKETDPFKLEARP